MLSTTLGRARVLIRRRTAGSIGLAVALLTAIVVVPSATTTQAALPAGSTYELQVAGANGVPSNASAVNLNLAAVNPTGPGHITAYPCGSRRPTTSTINYGPGNTIANNATVAIGTGGKVCIYTYAATDIIADLNGWYPAGSDYTAQSPTRLYDSRHGSRRSAGSTYELQVGGRDGVPGNASAVNLNLAAVNPSGFGHITAYPCGTARPTASTINYSPGTTIANNATIALGTGGKVCIYTYAATDIIADLNGWYPAGSDYTPRSPTRLYDSRNSGRRSGGSTYQLQVAGHDGVPGNASAVTLNLAAVNPSGPGFITVYPCGAQRPTTSTINYAPGQTVANNATVGIGSNGSVCIYTHAATDIIADLNGWYPASSDYNAVTPVRLYDSRGAGGGGGGGTPPPQSANGFTETFDGNTGLNRFDYDVFHRDNFLVSTTSWTGDHDTSCGSPDSQRTIRRSNPNESFYMCRDHLMTSVGDTSGYSIAWFSPKQTFGRGTHRKVSWDVNVTDLKARQWWEVVLVEEGQPFLTTVDWLASVAEIEAYHPATIAVGTGPFGNDGNIYSGGQSRDPLGFGGVCGADPEGCGSKAIRRSFSMTDNLNGTITFEFLGRSYTYPGQFPDRFRVYFKDHNYTPNKDGMPVGHTWHWDNVDIR